MTRHPPRPALAASVLATAVLALSVSAAASDDDVALAKALAQRGYTDVAERVLHRGADFPASPAAKRSECRRVLAQLRRFEALRAARAPSSARPAPAEVLRLFRDAEAAYRALGTDPAAAHASGPELARLLVAHAEFAAASAPSEPVSPLVDQALSLVANAEAAARAVEDATPEGTPERARAEDEVAGLRLIRIEALVARAAALPTGDPAARAALAAALDECGRFTWDYVGTLRCAWAFRWRGLVLARMGRAREACELLRDAATAVTERDGVRGAEELALAAHEDLARIAREVPGAEGDALVAEALLTAERLAADWPHHLDSAAGRRARLSVARLHARAKDDARAADDARAVLVAAGDTDPEAADEACALLADLAAQRPGSASRLDPELLARIAAAAARAQVPRRAIPACRAVILACTTPDLVSRFAWDAWESLGRVYGASGRWYEAYLCFDAIERAWKRDPRDARLAEIADRTSYFRADALARVAAATRDGEDRAAAEQAMADFARDHPGSSYAAGARGEGAFRAMSEAAALRRAGDTTAADRRTREAIDLVAAIGPDSPMYERAAAVVAEARRQLGDTAEAIRLASEWLDAKRPEAVTAGARRARDQGRAQALVTLMTALGDRAAAAQESERPAACRDTLAALARWEADVVRLVPAGRDQVDAWRAEALLGAGDLDAAEPIVLSQIRSRPGHAGTRWLAAAAAREADREADRRRTAQDAAPARELSLRAARLWEFVLQASETPDPEVARAAGLAFRAGGDLPHAADLLALAASLFRGAAARETAAPRRDAAAESARSLSLALARTMSELGRADEAIAQAAEALTAGDPEGAAVVARLSAGETLARAEVDWLVRRAAKSREATDVLAGAYAAGRTKERLVAAVQTLSALRYTLPRTGEPTAESAGLALRHAETLLALGLAGGPPDALPAVATVLDDALGSEEALARAESLLPGTRRRAEDLRRRAAEASRKP